MKKKKKKGIRITERDIKLFKYLYIAKVATLRQIKRDIFFSCFRSSMSRRINRLEKENLITKKKLNGKQKW
ncbi:MAG: hypothetical protein OXB84_08770, partial [Halobacteriovoraceae bacterium]|nr:hypothetical protein [Halobacteriovoraceae bacterium]